MIDEGKIKYTPEEWILVRINAEKPFYKVFGAWKGSYLNGDAWQMNSGVVKVEEDETYYYFHGESTSIYKCHKDRYGIRSMYNQGIINNYQKASKGKIEPIFDMPDVTNLKWEEK